MFAATTTRPDLAFTVSTLSQFNCDPRVIHLRAAGRALRYLVDTAQFVLRYCSQEGVALQGFTDADWAGEADGRSRSASVFKVAGGAISWQSRKQEGVATSTTEAEYKSLSEGAKEAIWLRRLMEELQGTNQEPVPLHCDNQSALALTSNPVLHQRTKHFRVSWHFVRDAVGCGEVRVLYVRTHLQDADLLTKALPGSKHKDNVRRIGLVSGTQSGRAQMLWGLLT
jgi:hypothetical protein